MPTKQEWFGTISGIVFFVIIAGGGAALAQQDYMLALKAGGFAFLVLLINGAVNNWVWPDSETVAQAERVNQESDL